MYHVFTRTWWKENPSWPNGLEPCAGPKETLDHVETEAEARALCAEFNAENDPGRLSLKAEYEED